MAYLVSVHKASAVRSAVKANFFAPDESSLIVAKANRAEIYAFTPSGLELRTAFTVLGTISGLLTLRLASSTTDHLFITTDHNGYFTVSWDGARRTIRNERTTQDVADRFLRDASGGPRFLADPKGRMIAIHVYEGLLLAIPIVSAERKARRKTPLFRGARGVRGLVGAAARGAGPGKAIGDLDNHSPIRMKELQTIDMAFLYGTDVPVIAVLHDDGHPANTHLATYKVVQLRGMCELLDFGIKSSNLEAEARFLIPVPEPLCGLLVLGEQTVVYLPAPKDTAEAIKRPLAEPAVFQIWAMVDCQRYLLADDAGRLKLLFLELDGAGKIADIKVETIGSTSSASVLVYLDNGHVFVGSQQGDSQVIKITPHDPKCRVIQTFTGIAPIFDFQVVGSSPVLAENQQNQYSAGKTRIVAACGGFRDGGLRCMRNGVGLKDLALLGNIEGVRTLSALKSCPDSEFDDALVVSLIDETRVFKFDAAGDAEEVDDFKGLSLDEETLTVAHLSGERILQVTPSRIKLIDAEGGTVLSEVAPPSKIMAVCTNDKVLVCNVGNNSVLAYDIVHGLERLASRTFDNEISCLFASPQYPAVCIVGFWASSKISMLSLPRLEAIAEAALSEQSTKPNVPRSIIVANILPNRPPSLLVSMSDGTLHTFSLDPGTCRLLDKKSLTLGTQASSFQALPRRDGTQSVFGAGDHPCLIYGEGDNSRLVYSAVTSENVTHARPFNAEAYPSSVVTVADWNLKISSVDLTRGVHISTLKVGDVVRRVSYSNERNIYGIVTIRSVTDISTGEERYTSFVRVVDGTEFAIIDSFELRRYEFVESILCTRLDNGDGTRDEKFLVGTGFQLPAPRPSGKGWETPESDEGRLLVLELSEGRRLKPAAELKVEGAVKAIEMVGNKIVLALDQTLEVFSYEYPMSPSRPELVKLASHRCHSEPIDLSVMGNHITVGDLMRGPFMLEYTADPPTLTEVARTYQSIWSTAVEMLDKDTVINCDAEGNLSVWQRDDALLVADQRRLRLIADMRLGEVVNRIRRLDVPAHHLMADAPLQPTAYIATVEGSVYLLASISEAKTQQLLQLQSNLAKVVMSPGDLEFNRWRAYASPARVGEEPYRFVDGDFLERFLALPVHEAEKVVAGVDSEHFALGVGVDAARALVESLRMFY